MQAAPQSAKLLVKRGDERYGPPLDEATTKSLHSSSRRYHQSFVRRRLALELPELCEVLLAKALKGDLNAVKLLWQMAELGGKAKLVRRAASRPEDFGFARRTLEEYRNR